MENVVNTRYPARSWIFRSCHLVLGLAASIALNASAAPKSELPAGVQRLLSAVREAKTAEEVEKLVTGAKLSESEAKLVVAEVAKPEWASKLESLKQTAPRPRPHKSSPPAYPGKSAAEVLAERRRLVTKSQADLVASSTKAVAAKKKKRATTSLSAGPVRPVASSISASLRPGPALGRSAPRTS